MVLEAASHFDQAPATEEMLALVQAQAAVPLWE
jgi:hypothetical protein